MEDNRTPADVPEMAPRAQDAGPQAPAQPPQPPTPAEPPLVFRQTRQQRHKSSDEWYKLLWIVPVLIGLKMLVGLFNLFAGQG